MDITHRPVLDFTQKNVLVTGGARGIGLATSLAFASLGANVAITYRANEVQADEARKRIEAHGVRSAVLKADTFDEHAHEQFLTSIVKEWGPLHVAVSNAGIWRSAKIDEMSIEDYREMMEINMTGAFVLAKVASRHMKKNGTGSIVLIGSTAGQRGESEHSHYAASKGATISFTKSLASELAPFGVRVNCVAPGWVRTDMTRSVLESAAGIATIQSAIPLGRAAEPEEIANAIAFIASPLASFITGEILNVNGGAVLCG